MLSSISLTRFILPTGQAAWIPDDIELCIPESYFVDSDGRLRGVYIGPLDAPYLKDKIEELLSTTNPTSLNKWEKSKVR